jgi:pSer/pThr/pTyr-binding forkhead associated (FHA) protein
LLLIGSPFAANAFTPSADKTHRISSTFEELKGKLEPYKDKRSLAADVPLVQGDDFQISKRTFIFYKSNMEMINKLQNNGSQSLTATSFSDDTLIGEMVKKEVTVSYAKTLRLEVTPQEVDAVISRSGLT